jgi:uncharacterized protein (DUF58 family)
VSTWVALAIAFAVIGAVAGVPGLVLVAAITLVYGTLTRLWTRYGVRRVEYGRTLGASRAVVGDEVALDVTIWNRKPLPLPWVAVDDLVTDGITIREQPQLDRDQERHGRRILFNAWSLAWYERVVRHFHVDADRRGSYEFGPFRMRIRDILGRDAAETEPEEAGTDSLVISPRTAPVRSTGHDLAPIGDRRARQGLVHDPALFGGVRPFQPGDSLRRIHWRATARLGEPVSRRYEPARGREVLIALDVQTIEGPHWQMTYDDEAFESLCVAAGSIARRLLADGAACGLAAASFTGTVETTAFLAPDAAAGQVTRVGALLARIGPVSSSPYERLLTWLTRRIPPGTTILALTARDPRTWLAAVRRLARSGYGVEIVCMGPDAALHAAAARHLGLRVRVGTLDPDWRTADALVLAG